MKAIKTKTPANTPIDVNTNGRAGRKKHTISEKYNLRPRLTTMNIVLLFVIGVIAQAVGTPFDVTTFTNQPGVYFEQTGDVRFINGEWTILIHYNLSAYFELRSQHQQGINKMDKICRTLNFISSTSQPSCVGIINQFNEKFKELAAGDSLVQASRHTRRRRSPFDFIGTIAS